MHFNASDASVATEAFTELTNEDKKFLKTLCFAFQAMQKAQVDRPEGGSTRPVDLATTEASGQRIVRQDYDEKRANTEGKESPSGGTKQFFGTVEDGMQEGIRNGIACPSESDDGCEDEKAILNGAAAGGSALKTIELLSELISKLVDFDERIQYIGSSMKASCRAKQLKEACDYTRTLAEKIAVGLGEQDARVEGDFYRALIRVRSSTKGLCEAIHEFASETDTKPIERVLQGLSNATLETEIMLGEAAVALFEQLPKEPMAVLAWLFGDSASVGYGLLLMQWGEAGDKALDKLETLVAENAWSALCEFTEVCGQRDGETQDSFRYDQAANPDIATLLGDARTSLDFLTGHGRRPEWLDGWKSFTKALEKQGLIGRKSVSQLQSLVDSSTSFQISDVRAVLKTLVTLRPVTMDGHLENFNIALQRVIHKMTLFNFQGVKDIRKNQLKAATDRLAWAQSPTFLAGLTASVLVADIIATPKDIKSIVTYALCYTSLLTATLSATLSALAAVYMQQQRRYHSQSKQAGLPGTVIYCLETLPIILLITAAFSLMTGLCLYPLAKVQHPGLKMFLTVAASFAASLPLFIIIYIFWIGPSIITAQTSSLPHQIPDTKALFMFQTGQVAISRPPLFNIFVMLSKLAGFSKVPWIVDGWRFIQGGLLKMFKVMKNIVTRPFRAIKIEVTLIPQDIPPPTLQDQHLIKGQPSKPVTISSGVQLKPAIYNEVQFDGNSTATDKAGHDLDTQAASTSATVNELETPQLLTNALTSSMPQQPIHPVTPLMKMQDELTIGSPCDLLLEYASPEKANSPLLPTLPSSGHGSLPPEILQQPDITDGDTADSHLLKRKGCAILFGDRERNGEITDDTESVVGRTGNANITRGGECIFGRNSHGIMVSDSSDGIESVTDLQNNPKGQVHPTFTTTSAATALLENHPRAEAIPNGTSTKDSDALLAASAPIYRNGLGIHASQADLGTVVAEQDTFGTARKLEEGSSHQVREAEHL